MPVSRTALYRVVAASLASILVLAPAPSALAFDSFWHSAASEGAGQQHGFTADAVNILQFGTFGPDFFGPLYDTILGEHIEELQAFFNMRMKANSVRKAGIYMHFDNLNGDLDRDWKIDYLFRRLLDNTRHVLKTNNRNPKLNEGTRKLLTLVALGSSMHMVEDFYSHTNWVHFDFIKLGFPQKQSIWKQDYAPSWFQVVSQLGPPALDGTETWPIEVRSGIYPAPAKGKKLPTDSFGVTLEHTYMNHDNSQLFYEGASQIKWHGFGAHPATDAATAKLHQLYAINSAAMAVNEWTDLVEQDPGAKQAIEEARDWQLQKFNPAMLSDLESGLKVILAFSCLAKKWDGDHPPQAQATQCSFVNYKLALPSMINEYWAAYAQYAILENLTKGIGDENNKYTFDLAWYKAHRPAAKGSTSVDLDDLNLQIQVPADTTIQSTSSSSVTLTGPTIGSMTITPTPSPQTAQQATQQAQQQGGTGITPGPATPPDWTMTYTSGGGSGRTVQSQHKVGQNTYSCGGSGTAAQATAITAACGQLRAQVE